MTAADFRKIAQEKMRVDSEHPPKVPIPAQWRASIEQRRKRRDLCPICLEPLTSDDFKQDKVIELASDEFAHTRCWEAND